LTPPAIFCSLNIGGYPAATCHPTAINTFKPLIGYRKKIDKYNKRPTTVDEFVDELIAELYLEPHGYPHMESNAELFTSSAVLFNFEFCLIIVK